MIDAHWAGEPASLLDIGCGLGAFLERSRIRHPTWSLNGTDIDQKAVAATEARVPGVVVTRAPADRLSHPNGSFDIVTAWDVIEHVEALSDVAFSIKAMLKPHGIFLFVVPVYDGILGPIVRLLDKVSDSMFTSACRVWWLDWAEGPFELGEWHGIFRYLFPGSHYVHWVTHRLRGHAPAILIVCRQDYGARRDLNSLD